MNSQPNRRTFRGEVFGAIGLLCLIIVPGAKPVAARQLQAVGSASPSAPSEQAHEAKLPEPAGGETLHLLVGRSLVVNSPVRVKRVSIADPTIIEAIIISPVQILLNGKTPGAVSLILWDESDQSQTFEVSVDMDILGLSRKIRETFPREPIRVEASKDVVLLSGRASSKLVADKIYQIVTAGAPKVISLMEVPSQPTKGEILLEVKFAEVDRGALTQFGVNLFSPGTRRNGPASTVGSIGTQQFGSPQLNSLTGSSSSTGSSVNTDFRLNDLLNLFVFRSDIDLGILIKALQQRNLLQILAEPNLLTETDKEASFLAGGEFPFPVVQGGTNFTAVTIQFKEFGVRLNFKPTLTEDGRIHLKVRPEVSALDFSNALTVSGFVVPAISTRRVESEMELADGQSFAIAGLVDDRVTQTLAKFPGLGNIPILGQLFKSRTLNKTKTELLVVVTPHIVKPLSADQVPSGPKFMVPFLPPAGPEPAKTPGKQ